MGENRGRFSYIREKHQFDRWVVVGEVGGEKGIASARKVGTSGGGGGGGGGGGERPQEGKGIRLEEPLQNVDLKPESEKERESIALRRGKRKKRKEEEKRCISSQDI